MTYLTLISLCLATAGVGVMMRKGVPESISGLVWQMSEKLRWIWSWWMFCVAITLMPPLMSALDDVGWLGWLTNGEWKME